MEPAVFAGSQLQAAFAAGFWTFVRIGAALMVAPPFGSRALSTRIRLVLALALTAVIAPMLPAPPAPDAFSAAWFATLATQLAIGLLIGFVLQMVFEAIVMAGELISLGMGLSFATLADPLRGVSTGVLGQYFLVLATLLFLSMDGHLALIGALVESFIRLPVGVGLPGDGLLPVAAFAGRMFLFGVQIALPAMISLLLVNLAFGVISRAAPTLNPIAVGFPITLTLGFLILQFSMSPLLAGLRGLLDGAWTLLAGVLQAG